MWNNLIDYGMESAAWSGNDLVIGDDAKIARIRRASMSASTASKLLQCPAAAVAARLMPRSEDPFGPAELGTAAHSVMEEFYELPPEERTREAIHRLIAKGATAQWSLDKLAERTREAIRINNENRLLWVNTITEWTLGIFDLEDPTKVDVYRTEWQMNGQRIAHGFGAEDGVPIIGYIDRTDRDENGQLRIRDYKFGKYKAPNPRFGDDYGDQIRIYSQAVQVETGAPVAEGVLLYPRAGKARVIDLSPDAVATTMASFRGAWNVMHRTCDAKRFPTQPSLLCGWCPLANSCPRAKVESENAKSAAKKQPSSVELGIPTIRRGATIVPAEPAAATAESGQGDAAPRMWVVKEPEARAAVQSAAPAPAERNGDSRVTDNMQHRAEGPAYEETVNGSLNFASFAAIGANGIVMEAFDILSRSDVQVSAENMARLSDVLAGIVLRAQLAVTGSANFQRGANTRLRGMLHTWVERRPLPFGGDEAAWNDWISRAERFLIVSLNAVSELYERHPVQNNSHLHFVTTAAPVAAPAGVPA